MINSVFFKEEILEKKQSAFVAFIASWCTPSMLEKDVFEKLKEAYKDKIVIECIDIDENTELADEYNVRSLPTILAIDEGEIVENLGCFQSEDDFKDAIDYYLKQKELMQFQNSEENQNSCFSTLKGVYARLKEALHFH